MASQTPSSPGRRRLRAAVALSLAAPTLATSACGGGTIGGPVAGTTAAPAPAVAQRTPSAVATAARPTATAAPPGRAVHRAPGGSARRPATTTAASAPPPASSSPASGAASPPTTTGRARDGAQPAGQPLDERAVLTLTRRVSPAHYFQQGTVTGTYDGTMEIEARITSKGVLVRFTATLPGGTISGRGVAVAILDSATWPGLRGTATIAGGTGRFAGLHGRGLRVSGRARPDASRAHVRLAGTVEP